MRAALLVLLLLAPLPAAAAAADADFALNPRLGAALPADAPLRDEAGHPLALGTLLGGPPLVLVLGYFHCPALCGVVRDDALGGLERAGLRPGADYRLLVLSIDPAETLDDAARAKEGALSRFPDPAADANWRFLTAPASSIDEISRVAGFRFRFDPATKLFLHPAGLVVATQAGIVSSALPGVGYAPSDIRSAVLRADAGAVATAISPVLLLCFHFDPKTGTYDFAVFRALSTLAALTILTLLGLFFLLQRRRRSA